MGEPDAEAAVARELALAQAREAELRARLDEVSSALLEANQSLAELPVLHNRLAGTVAENGDLRERIAAYEQSTSWRLTTPLRRLGHLLRRRP